MDDIKQGQRPGRVTIRTVAADAGVSVAAVSKVLRNAYGVSDALRQNVMTSIERLGYRPSVSARGMRGQTYTVGLLLVEMGNPFLPEVVEGVNAILAPQNYKAMVGIGQSQMQIEASLIESMIDYNMDGLIIVAPQMAGALLAQFARQIPIVVIGHHEATATEFDTVNSDDQEGAAIAVRQLVEAGLTDIAMITMTVTSSPEANVIHQREVGYMRAMIRAGLAEKARILAMPTLPSERLAFMAQLMAAPDRPRALFCWSDLDAIPLINQAKTMGLSLPEDIAIVGYDNSPLAALPLIGLSSIDQSGRKMGSLAAETLLSRIRGRKVANHFLLEPVFTPRSST